MNWIKEERFLKYDNGNAVILALVEADTAEDLPAADDFPNRVLSRGSVAHDIDSGDYYCLNSLGTWKKQKIAGGSLGSVTGSFLTVERIGEPVYGDLTEQEDV